jgi:formiminotetrahydrofolate cyclodeaminase
MREETITRNNFNVATDGGTAVTQLSQMLFEHQSDLSNRKANIKTISRVSCSAEP